MDCQRIAASELPGATRLYSTFLSDFSRVADFYFHPPSIEGAIQAARELRFDEGVRNGVTDVLAGQNRAFGSDEAVSRNLERLRGGAYAVVTGQQVGLFGGPAYSIYKALTAIHVARELTARGIEAVPVFWLATEDHDLAEVNHCYIPKRGGFEKLELEPFGLTDRRVGEIPLGEAIRELSGRVLDALEGSYITEVGDWISSSYAPGETFGSAFGKLMARIFAGRGLILLDPMAAALHQTAAPTILGALKLHGELAAELVARSEALERAGFHAQVKVTGQTTQVFRIVGGQRLVMRSANGSFATGDHAELFEVTLRVAEQHPEDFSPGALLRPVVQDTLLPTIAYIGGPAEIAYHAQTSVLYAKLLGRAPAILPRAGGTLVTSLVANLMKKYELDANDVLRGRQHVRARLESEALPKALAERFEQGEQTIKQALESLREPIGKLDQTLLGALDNASEKILYQFSGLRAKAGRAEGFRTGVLNTHESEILNLLLPEGGLQERFYGMLTFLAAEGRQLLDQLDLNIRTGSGDHCFVSLPPPVR